MTTEQGLYDKDKGKLDYLYEDGITPDKCPDCGSPSVVRCPGGTCRHINPAIKWICPDCLNEW